MKNWLPPTALCALSLCATAPACATASSFAEIVNYSVTLEDLDLTDAWAPSITFTDVLASASSSYNPRRGENPATISDVHESTSMTAPLASQLSINGDTASSLASGGTFGADGAFSGLHAQARAQSFTPLSASGGSHQLLGTFTLSPNTAVRFSSDSRVSTAVDAGPPYGSASAGVGIEGGLLGVNSSDNLDSQVFGVRAPDGSFPAVADEQQRTLSLLFANDTAFASSGYFHLSASTSSTVLTAPIPEPSTWALMLLGLGAVGWVTHRRQRAAAGSADATTGAAAA